MRRAPTNPVLARLNAGLEFAFHQMAEKKIESPEATIPAMVRQMQADLSDYTYTPDVRDALTTLARSNEASPLGIATRLVFSKMPFEGDPRPLGEVFEDVEDASQGYTKSVIRTFCRSDLQRNVLPGSSPPGRPASA